jgi:hypothetical protein
MNHYLITKTHRGQCTKCTKCKNLIFLTKNKYCLTSTEPGVIILICPKCYKCNVMCTKKSHNYSGGNTIGYVGCAVDTTRTVSNGRYHIYNIILKYAADKCVKDDICDYLMGLFDEYFSRPVLNLIMDYYYSDDIYLYFIKSFNSQMLWSCYICGKKYKLTC